MIFTAFAVAFALLYVGVLAVSVPMLLVIGFFMLVHALWKALS